MGNSSSSAVGYNSTIAATSSNLHRILDGMIKQTHAKNPLQNWIEDAIAADVIPMDELIATNVEWKDSHGKAQSILRSTSGITSLIASSIFIWMIMRSHERLSTTLHRLLLGLCISDIISSLSFSTFNSHAPSDIDYWDWNAKGNQHTCTTQGFFAMFGAYGGLYYNASLNLYFLAVVKYKKSEEFIRAKIEPFLHAVPIAMAISHSVHKLVKKHYNGTGTCYWPVNEAPHCQGYDVGEIREGFEIPCWRGIEGAWTAAISSMVLLFIPILIMIVSLGMIYSAVRTQEEKLARYGVSTLRVNLQQQSVSTQQSDGVWGRISTSITLLMISLKSRTWSLSCRNTNKPITRSNNMRSRSRAVMHKAFGYSSAWFLSYGFFLIGIMVKLATWSYPNVLSYLTIIFVPLQGLFNLLIFMHPKIMAAKKSKKWRGGETVSWCKAFSTAFWSRGKQGNNQGTIRSNLREANSNRRQKKKTRNEDAASGYVKSPTFGKIKKKKKTKRANNISQEEEKCEIQVLDNLNPTKTKAMSSATSTATYAPNIVPSSYTTTMGTVDMNKVDFEDDNINVGNMVYDVQAEEADEDIMLNQDDDEEEMEEFEEENMDIVSMGKHSVQH